MKLKSLSKTIQPLILIAAMFSACFKNVVINEKIAFSFFLLMVMVIFTACPSSVCTDLDPKYQFLVTASIKPSNDSLEIGDTLFFESTFPTKLKDGTSASMIDYSNSIDIGGSIFFDNNYLQPTVVNDTTVDDFKIIALSGRVITNNKSIPESWRQIGISYEEKNGIYQIKLAIIPKKKGVYALINNYALSNGVAGKKCEKASFDVTFSDTDQHLYYYYDLFGTALSDYDAQRIYFFKVY